MRSRTISVLLVVLLFRAYIPVGFMPASGTPFLLQICPVGLPTQMLAHHQHHPVGGHAQFANCPFGSAPANGPISHLLAHEPPGLIPSPPAVTLEPVRLVVRLERAHQPRGPPSPA
jgi:hypothetical protein